MSEELNGQEHFQPIPSPFDVRIQEADLYVTHGLFDEAETAYRELIEDIKNGDLDTREKNRLTLLVQEKLDKTCQNVRSDEDVASSSGGSRPKESQKIDPAQAFNQGLALKDVDLFEEAMAEFEGSAKFGYKKSKSYQYCGECALELKKPELALEYFQKALNLNSTPKAELNRILLRLAQTAEQIPNYETAFEFYNELWAKDSEEYPFVESKLAEIKEVLKKEYFEKLDQFVEMGDIVECRVIIEVLVRELDTGPDELEPYCEKLSFPITDIFPEEERVSEQQLKRASDGFSHPHAISKQKRSPVSVIRDLGLPDLDSPTEGARKRRAESRKEALAVEGTLVSVDPEILPPLLKGKKVHKYSVIKTIARGNSSLVMEVEDIESGNRYKAQGLTEASGNMAKDMGFYLKWAELISNMYCKQVARIVDVAMLDDQPLLIMENVGSSLEMVLETKKILSVPETLKVSFNILKGVAYCHTHLGLDGERHKVYHLDLRPSRILWDVVHKERQKIINQGLITLLANGKDYALNYGLFDCPNHLLAYKAPEQFRPEILRKLHRSPVCTDIYSLGIIMYEMLTGCVAFQGPTYDDYEKQHLEHYPVPPKVLISSIPEDLDDIVLKCLRKKPEERWRSVTELYLALERVKVIAQ